MMRPKSFKVSQITAYLRDLLDDDVLLSGFFVEGEISNLRQHSRGHIYFTVKDERAALSAVIFKNEADSLDFEMADGQKVLIYGRLAHYEKSGQTQLIAEMVNRLGVGALFQDFQALKEKLELEGVFANRRAIPAFPQVAAVVTSPTGAAVRDIITVMRRRNPLVKLIIVPALVQGAQAPSSIAEAIALANETKADVIICGRGGGSIEDLWAFNTEIVARAVYESQKPVISAVGHETDFTLCDFAADLRAETPTAAAQLACVDFADLSDDLADAYMRLNELLEGRVADSHKMLRNRMLRLAECITNKITEGRAELEQKTAILERLAPMAVLERGFAAVVREGESINNGKMLNKGDIVTIKFGDINRVAIIAD